MRRGNPSEQFFSSVAVRNCWRLDCFPKIAVKQLAIAPGVYFFIGRQNGAERLGASVALTLCKPTSFRPFCSPTQDRLHCSNTLPVVERWRDHQQLVWV
ncbi:hypothetical protein IQ272_30925 [Chroococcidiopsidales cyanobacterium LEGE 13417]|nr:hypothetical protein [Chroococcidiopsidales cyanobacterium LEGE 13417]